MGVIVWYEDHVIVKPRGGSEEGMRTVRNVWSNEGVAPTAVEIYWPDLPSKVMDGSEILRYLRSIDRHPEPSAPPPDSALWLRSPDGRWVESELGSRQEMEEWAREYAPLGAERVRVMPNGVEPDEEG